MQQLQNWLKRNKLQVEILNNNTINILQVGVFLLLEDREVFFDEKLSLNLYQDEVDIKCDYYLYEFGGVYYYTPKHSPKIQFNEFKYLGLCEQELDPVPFLGMHGSFELLNGSKPYSFWVKKAKFLGINTLGICERNTLAGIMKFQNTCAKNKIKPIIGEEIVVRKPDESTFIIKLYCINEIGWQNLLQINKQIRIINNGYIEEAVLLSYFEGLVCVLCYSSNGYQLIDFKHYTNHFTHCYFQIDTVIWENEEQDQKYLTYLKNYLEKGINVIPPILINDAYYLDEEDNEAKSILNGIGGLTHQHKSKNQYFKNTDDNFMILSYLFKDDDERVYELFEQCTLNLIAVEEICNFQVKSNKLHLPEFILPDDFNNKEDFLLSLIERGLQEKIISKVENEDIYYERLQVEFETICEGGFIDYFLVSWDIIRFCRENDILVGLGRGSAGGSLIVYCLNITQIDPIKFGLFFERFMNKGRMKGNLPDLDLDFQASRRDEVKSYIEQKYGNDYVCSIGTYTTFQIKAAFRDGLKQMGLENKLINHHSKTLYDEESSWVDIFTAAAKNIPFKEFIKEQIDKINKIKLIFDQPKAESIHACGMLIMPKNENIFTQIPLKKIENELVSEWEGNELASLGYLKDDILGIKQLDKIKTIINLIKESTNEEINVYDLPLDDKGVYKYFQKGYNGDLFHFGSAGLTNYSRQVKPENIEELIAMIALFRPGVMGIGAHDDFVKLKFGLKKPEYDYNLESVTKETYGIYVYQEQIMQACQILGNFTLVEADDIRKAMGHSIPELILSYKTKFIDGAIKNGCEKEAAENIWGKLELFAGYGFNKSHSVAYALTGYICQWLKVHYPFQYWTVAFSFASAEDIIPFTNEINITSKQLKIKTPSINYSKEDFYFFNNSLYWSFTKIKGVGEIAVKQLIEERDKNGEFFSFEEFLKRRNKSKVNKTVIEGLIYSGAFDEIEQIKDAKNRFKLLNQYYLSEKIKTANFNYIETDNIKEDYWWLLKQRSLIGIAYFNWKDILTRNDFKKEIYELGLQEMKEDKEYSSSDLSVGGVIVEIIKRKSKKGEFAQIQIEHNCELIFITLWNNIWDNSKKEIEDKEGKIILLSNLQVKYDKYKNTNALRVTDKTIFKILQ